MAEKTFYSKTVHTKGQPIKNLNAKEYEDPRDSKYLNALKLNKTFDEVFKKASEYGVERAAIVGHTGSNVLITEKNMPYLHNCIREACEILGVNKVPKTYVVQNPYLNACTMGAQDPIILLHDSLIKRLTHEELMFIIGHEVGHIKSEHVQYHQIGELLALFLSSGIDAMIPFAGPLLKLIVSTGLNVAYYDWSRKSEFTADHAGLLCCQDLGAAISALAKLGGYPQEFYDTFDANTFIEQAKSFDELTEDSFNKFVKVMLILYKSHPWCVQRAKELLLWVESGAYAKIILRNSDWLKYQVDYFEDAVREQQVAAQQLPPQTENAQPQYAQPQQSQYAPQQQPQQAQPQQPQYAPPQQSQQAQPQQNYSQPQNGFSQFENSAKALFSKGQDSAKSFVSKISSSGTTQPQYSQPQPVSPNAAQTPPQPQYQRPVQNLNNSLEYFKNTYREASWEEINELTKKTLGDINPISQNQVNPTDQM